MPNILSPRIKFKEFVGQYIVGSIISTAAAVVAGLVVQQVTGSAVLTAIAATLAEDFVWYVYLWLYYILRRADGPGAAIVHIIADFGAAELLDSFCIRPVFMYLMPMVTHNQASGIIIATILADIIYTAIGLNRQRHRSAS